MKGWCPDCDTLQSIESTGERITPFFSAKFKKLLPHSWKTETRAGMVIESQCPGTGKKI
jgi:hypothetical protein